MSFGGSTVEVPAGTANVVPFLAPMAGTLNPWMDAKLDEAGQLQLPEYTCELPADPRKWKPGDYTDGVDNIERNAEGNAVKEWGGQNVGYTGNMPFSNLDPFEYPENV